MSKKKRIILIVAGVVAVIAVAVASYLIYMNKTRTPKDFCSLDTGKITGMKIMNGANGQTVQVSKEDYETVTTMLEGVKMPGIFKEKKKYAYPMEYAVTITYEKDETIFWFYNVKCEVDGKNYNLDDIEGISDVLEEVYEKSGGTW